MSDIHLYIKHLPHQGYHRVVVKGFLPGEQPLYFQVLLSQILVFMMIVDAGLICCRRSR